MKTLGEIVSLALAQNEASTKVAALQDAAPTDPGDELLAAALGQLEIVPVEEPSTKVASEQPTTSNMDVADYSMKIAAALRHAADAVKVALSADLPTSSGGHDHETGNHPAAPGPAGKELPATVGPQGTPANDGDKPATGKGPSNTPGKGTKVATDRAAAERLLEAKVAEHRVLVSMGQTAAADKVASEVKEMQGKLASGPGSLDTSDGGAGASPTALSNETLIRMTRAQARDASIRQAAAQLSIPVKVPNDIAANIGSNHGVKVSGFSGGAFGPVGAAIADKEHRGESFKKTLTGGLKGYALGAAPGAALAGAGALAKNKKLTGAGLAAGVLGANIGTVIGQHKGQEKARAEHKAKQKSKEED